MSMNLLDIEKEINENKKHLNKLTKDYEENKNVITMKMLNLEYQRNVLLGGLDLEKIENARRFIYTRGMRKNFYGDAHKKLIEAINDVTNGCVILRKEYLGCKDYDRFSGQGITCEYGYSPSHGSVVMEIGMKNEDRKKITITDDDLSDILYYLRNLESESNRQRLLRENE